MRTRPLFFEENTSTTEDHKHSAKTMTLSLIHSLFDAFIWLYPPHDIDTRYQQRNIKRIMLLYALETLMFISFIHYDGMNIKDWNTYSEVWIAISFLRADKIFTYSGMYHIWQAILNTFIYLPMAGVAYLTLLSLYKKPLKFKYKQILIKVPIFISTGIMIGPISSGLYSLIKYRNSVKCFSQELSAEAIVIHPIIGTLAAVGISSYISFCIIVKILSVEVRHDLAKYNNWAMVKSRQEVLKVLWTFFLVFSYYFILPDITWMHFILISVSSGILCYLYYQRLPFYNPLMNKLQAMQFCCISFISFSHLLGYYLDSSTLILILSFIITPILLINIATVFNDHIRSSVANLNSSFHSINTIQDFELAIRDMLIRGDTYANEIFTNFYDHDVIKREKLLYIIDSYFTYATLDNKPLSRIKLSLIHQGNSSFEDNYHEYRCRICIENEIDSESLRYMKYNSDIQAAESEDETLCINLIELWEQLYSIYPNHNKIRNLVFSIHKQHENLRKSYLNLLQKYPNVPYINELLGSMIVDICNKHSKGNRFLQKAAFQREDLIRTVNGNKLSFFYPDAGVMIISCDTNYFSKVVYANSQALEITEYTHNALIGLLLSQIMPYPYSECIYTYMKRFANNRNMEEMEVNPKFLFFTNQNYRLVPVLCSTKVDVLGQSPCFLMSLLRYEKCSNMALLNEDGIILSHTENFSSALGVPNDNLIGFNLYNSFSALRERYFKPFYLMNFRSIIVVRIPISSQFVNIAIVFIDLLEIEDFYSPGIKSQFAREQTYELESKGTDLSSQSNVALSFPSLEVGFSGSDYLYLFSSNDLSNVTHDKSRYSQIGENNCKEEEVNERHEKKSLTYSSVNSSFRGERTSSKSPAKINIVHKSTRSLKICLLISTVSTLGMIIGISVFIQEALDTMQKASEVNNEMSKGLFYLYSMSHGARTLNLISNQDYYQEDLNIILSEMETAVKNTRKMIKSIDKYKNSNIQDKLIFENLFYKSSVLTWELEASSIMSYSTNLMNIFYDFTYHTQMLMNKTDQFPIQSQDSSLFYLLANSHGSAYDAFNSTYISILDLHDSNLDLMKTYMLISFSSIGIVLLICFIFIGYRLAIVQKSSNIVWQMIYSIPLSSLIEFKRRSVDRLNTVHNIMLESSNEMIGFDRYKLRNVKYYNAWRGVSITYLLVLVLSVVYYSVIYHVIMEQMITYIQLKQELLYVSFESMIYNLLMYEWIRESVYDSTVYNLTCIIPEYQHTLTSQHEFTHNIQMYYKSISEMKQLIIENSLDEPEIQDLFYQTQTSEHAILSKGLHYAQVGYFSELLRYRSIQQSGPELKTLHSITEEMIKHEYSLAIKIQDILDLKIEKYSDTVFALISIYCLVLVLCLLLVFIPTIKRIDTDITYAWKFYLNFNLEDLI